MAEPTWVLGFDGHCLTCRQLAEEVARLANGRLAVRSLREPEVVAWRARALGADAPWAPTLLRVQGARVEAWTGRRLAWQLARLLGPGRALALAERLVALNGDPARGAPALTRRRFLRRLGAAALAFGLLASGKLALPQAARAAGAPAATPTKTLPWWAVESLRQTPIDGTARQALLGRALASAEIQTVLEPEPALVSPTATQAAEHALADGRTLRALALGVGDDEVLVYYEDDTGRRAALRYRVVAQGDKPQLKLVAATDEALVTPAVRHSEILPEQTCTPPLIPCSCCCGNFDYFELVGCCGLTCVAFCRAGWWILCAACILAWCPACIWHACRAGWSCTCCCAEPGT